MIRNHTEKNILLEESINVNLSCNYCGKEPKSNVQNLKKWKQCGLNQWMWSHKTAIKISIYKFTSWFKLFTLEKQCLTFWSEPIRADCHKNTAEIEL